MIKINKFIEKRNDIFQIVLVGVSTFLIAYPIGFYIAISMGKISTKFNFDNIYMISFCIGVVSITLSILYFKLTKHKYWYGIIAPVLGFLICAILAFLWAVFIWDGPQIL